MNTFTSPLPNSDAETGVRGELTISSCLLKCLFDLHILSSAALLPVCVCSCLKLYDYNYCVRNNNLRGTHSSPPIRSPDVVISLCVMRLRVGLIYILIQQKHLKTPLNLEFYRTVFIRSGLNERTCCLNVLNSLNWCINCQINGVDISFLLGDCFTSL